MANRRTRPSSSRVHQRKAGARRSKSISRKSQSRAVKAISHASAPHASAAAHEATLNLAVPETSDRDRKESQIAAGQLTVGDHHAFALQGWGEVARETLRANQAFVTSVFRLFCAPIF